jgi:hypothetical protein
MKIEIKPFKDRVRFVASIAYIRLKKRAGAVKFLPRCFAPNLQQNNLTLRDLF